MNKGTLWHRAMRSMNYKPGWWAVYFIYCAIPVSIYIWYLVRRAREVHNRSKHIKVDLSVLWLIIYLLSLYLCRYF